MLPAHIVGVTIIAAAKIWFAAWCLAENSSINVHCLSRLGDLSPSAATFARVEMQLDQAIFSVITQMSCPDIFLMPEKIPRLLLITRA